MKKKEIRSMRSDHSSIAQDLDGIFRRCKARYPLSDENEVIKVILNLIKKDAPRNEAEFMMIFAANESVNAERLEHGRQAISSMPDSSETQSSSVPDESGPSGVSDPHERTKELPSPKEV